MSINDMLLVLYLKYKVSWANTSMSLLQAHLLLSLLVVSTIEASGGCPRVCKDVICIGERTLLGFCRQGIVKDSCGCCHVCRKSEGDSCGGYMDVHGKCGHGLHCHVTENRHKTGKCRASLLGKFVPKIVKKVKRCEHKCTPEFCSTNPQAICSARKLHVKRSTNCDEKEPSCHHTSCSACFLKSKAKCPRCRQTNFACIARYARCLRSVPAKIWDLSVLNNRFGDFEFHCLVPQCPR